MRVEDLMRMLEGMDPDAEVRFVVDQFNPMESNIRDAQEIVEEIGPDGEPINPTEKREFEEYLEENPDGLTEDEVDDLRSQFDPVERLGAVYLIEGRQIGYLDSDVSYELGVGTG